MADDGRPQRPQHGVLRVEVVGKELLVGGAAGAAASAFVQGRVVVDGDGVHVVDGADEEVEGVGGEEPLDVLLRRGPDPVDLDADEELDLRGVGGA